MTKQTKTGTHEWAWNHYDSYNQLIEYTPIPSWVSDPKFIHIRDHYIRYHNVMNPGKNGHRWELQNRIKSYRNNGEIRISQPWIIENTGNARFVLYFQGKKEVKDKIFELLVKEYGKVE